MPVDFFCDLGRVHLCDSPIPWLCSGSAEREGESFHAQAKELDCELSIGDGLWLPNQLVQTLFGDGTVALLVNVDAVSRAWRLSIDQDAKSHGSFRPSRAHDEMKITGVKTVHDPPVRLVQHGSLV